MKKQPLVSIIIPTYNRAHLICETLNSVLGQTYTNWECIVVDDGSTDETSILMAAYCDKDARFQYHHRPVDRPKGANTCRNYGFEVSNGEYVNWFDDDDVMLEKFLSNKAQNLSVEIDIIICSGYYTDEYLNNREFIELNKKMNLFRDYVIWKQQILTPSVMFKKSFLENKRLFNLKITRGQETEFFSRLFFKLPKSKFIIINAPLFLYRQHSNTKTFNNKTYRSDFILSQSYIMLENYKRGYNLKDTDITSYCYKYLVKFFYSTLKNKDLKNSSIIWTRMIKTINFRSKLVYIEIFFVGILLNMFRISSYKLEKRWQKFQSYNFKI